jgi:hypothetical protein
MPAACLTTDALAQTQLIDRLIFEPLKYPINKGYRNSLPRSLLTLAYLYARSQVSATRPPADLRGDVLCFGVFKNELQALEEAVDLNPHWRKVPIGFPALSGADWRAVMRPAPLLLPGFMRCIARLGGALAVRNFVYPFVGLLVFEHFRQVFAALEHRPTIVTANLVHPISVGVHLAALDAGLSTIFWEHAMTPRFMAKDSGYAQYYVHCEHTRRSFIEGGIAESRVRLIRPQAIGRAVPIAARSRLARIAVSVNDLDELPHVEAVARLLRGLGRTVVLRVHDSDRRLPALRELARRTGCELSSAVETPINEFVTTVDLVIAGNSNVVLDCVKARMPVLYYWPGDPQLFDYYGIVAAAGCEHANSPAALQAILETIDRGRDAAI